MQVAIKTLKAIEDVIHADQGASFRKYLKEVLPHMEDSYRGYDFPFRTHMGASLIGGACGRAVWYGFRWTNIPDFEGRLIRLFNRGHLEEGRFIAMLLAIGVQVYQQDENGKQFKISRAGGHFGGSGDGIGYNIPDLQPNTPCLLEMKTSADKYFNPIKKKGVKSEKFEHYVQMQCYMYEMGLPVALYMIVNKNNDELHAEIVTADSETAEMFLNKGETMVFMQEAPMKVSQTPGYFKCRFCDHKPVCHNKAAPVVTCRSCVHSRPRQDGKWWCENENYPFALTKEEQFKACSDYERLF